MHSLKRSSASEQDHDDWWSAICARDHAADDHVVYAVHTTGIYCRPSCPSRRPKRQNVSFHATASAAETAGFRACLRCNPAGSSVLEKQIARVVNACRSIQEAETPPGLEVLAKAEGLSLFHFQRLFRTLTGVTPKVYSLAFRAERLRDTLPGSHSVTEAMYDAGYNASSRFYTDAMESLGMRPSSYRDRGRGARIRFAICPCPIGFVLVAATDNGVCAIDYGENRPTLAGLLKDRFRQADSLESDACLERASTKVISCIQNAGCKFGLPAPICRTVFKYRVWKALQEALWAE